MSLDWYVKLTGARLFQGSNILCSVANSVQVCNMTLVTGGSSIAVFTFFLGVGVQQVREWWNGFSAAAAVEAIAQKECRCFVEQSQKECIVRVQISVATAVTIGVPLLVVLGAAWHYGCRSSSRVLRVSELRRGGGTMA